MNTLIVSTLGIQSYEKPYKSEGNKVGALIVAEMSSKGNLTTPEYAQKCIELAKNHENAIGIERELKSGEFFKMFTFANFPYRC